MPAPARLPTARLAESVKHLPAEPAPARHWQRLGNPAPTDNGITWRSYYYAGSTRVAMREQTISTNVVYPGLRWAQPRAGYLHSDHLGSASLATCGNTAGCGGTAYGAAMPGSETRYKPYGEMRVGGNGLPTDYRFTGQQQLASLGLYNYGARYYDPVLGRFLSADTLVPSPANPQSLNRYAYTLNNPLKYTDPTGHMVACDNYGLGCDGLGGADPSAIFDYVDDSQRRADLLLTFALTHPEYNPTQDSLLVDTEQYQVANAMFLAKGRAMAQEAKEAERNVGVGEVAKKLFPQIVPLIILGMVIDPPDQEGNREEGGVGGSANSSARLRGKSATEAAERLGYTKRIPPQKAHFDSHGQPIFYNPKTKTYISPDADGHGGGVWKMFDRSGRRLGTYDMDLSPIGD